MTVLRQRFLQDLELAGFSERTCEAYVRAVRQLAAHFRQSPDTLSEAQVRDYFSHLKNERQFARGSLTIAYSAVKFFFRRTVPRDWKTLEGLRVPPEKKLPDVLTVEEIRRIIAATRSEPCRVCLWTIYSLGLRLSEGVSLEVGDLDPPRALVHVHRGKGSVDRYVPLPGSTLDALRRYWATHSKPLLFTALGRGRKQGRAATEPMPRATIQGALCRVVKELRIQKRVSVHTLRHSYATHLLEAGLNLRLIQKYLGHKSLQTPIPRGAEIRASRTIQESVMREPRLARAPCRGVAPIDVRVAMPTRLQSAVRWRAAFTIPAANWRRSPRSLAHSRSFE